MLGGSSHGELLTVSCNLKPSPISINRALHLYVNIDVRPQEVSDAEEHLTQEYNVKTMVSALPTLESYNTIPIAHLCHQGRDERMSLSPGRSRLLLSSTNAYCLPIKTPAPHAVQSHVATRRRSMLRSLTRPSLRKGYTICKLCDVDMWGPNGKLSKHICLLM